MKRVELGAIVRYPGPDGALMEVYSIGEGRTIHMKPVGEGRCRHCGHYLDPCLLEHSPAFQENVEPVTTAEARG